MTDTLADYAESLIRRDQVTMRQRLSAADAERFDKEQQGFISVVRAAIDAGDFRRALMYLGNDSSAGFYF